MSNQKSLDQFIAEGRSPLNKSYGCYILAEGDSWFNLGFLPTPGKARNLLDPLHFKKDTVIVNLATLGDTLEHMERITRNPHLFAALDLRNWDLIFLSGGGNDLIDALLGNYFVNGQKLEILNKPSVPGNDFKAYINTQGMKDFLGQIENYYVELASFRSTVTDGKNKDTEIITHCYDYIQPRDAPAKILKSFGPWVYTAMTEVYRIPEKFWLDIIKHVFDELQQMMVGLETKIRKFRVLNTLGTLTLAKPHTTGNSNDWKNEIHPNAGGYEKLAKMHIQPLIDKQLI
jgi:lysophospholipase L1-like esterase